MSGLILPYRKHWRTDWRALLMSSLRLTSSHLTYTPSAHLALCDDCLCETLAPAPTSCQCQSVDYGPYKTFGTATVTISGSHTPTAATSPACSAPASCASVNGTYVIACDGDVDQVWRIDQFVCTSGGQDYYYANSARIVYQTLASPVYVRVRLGSFKYFQTAGLANPYPSLTLIPTQATAGVVYQHEWSEATTGRNRWVYEIGGSCREECNTIATTRGCHTTSGALTLSTSYIAGSAATTNVCHPSSLTVSASITAAA